MSLGYHLRTTGLLPLYTEYTVTSDLKEIVFPTFSFGKKQFGRVWWFE